MVLHAPPPQSGGIGPSACPRGDSGGDKGEAGGHSDNAAFRCAPCTSHQPSARQSNGISRSPHVHRRVRLEALVYRPEYSTRKEESQNLQFCRWCCQMVVTGGWRLFGNQGRTGTNRESGSVEELRAFGG